MDIRAHQSKLAPEDNKFHAGNGSDGKHYWLTPPAVYDSLNAEFRFTFDPCPFPKPADFDGLTCEWGESSYVNPPFGSIMHQGPGDKKPKKKGPTAWVRKAITEHEKGKRVVLVYPVDKWVLMLLQAGAQVRNLGDVRWLATEDGSEGKGTGRHIACFILDPESALAQQPAACRCVDCGGDRHEHDAHCAYMRDLHGAQPAAVNEAMVERALAAYLRRQEDGESLYGCVTAALTAALAGQQQENGNG